MWNRMGGIFTPAGSLNDMSATQSHASERDLGVHLDHTFGEASRPHTGGGISTAHWGRHLDHTLGEASQLNSEEASRSLM